MASHNLFLLVSDISPVENTSSPKRIGTRTKEDFTNFVSFFLNSITLEIKSLTPLEPISIAANL